MARKGLPLTPKPMYVSNSVGSKMLKEMGLPMKQKRIKSKLDVEDVSNRPGDRAKGGY